MTGSEEKRRWKGEKRNNTSRKKIGREVRSRGDKRQMEGREERIKGRVHTTLSDLVTSARDLLPPHH